MTPLSYTIFAICLFLALCALNSWMIRRERNARRARASGGELLRDSEAVQL